MSPLLWAILGFIVLLAVANRLLMGSVGRATEGAMASGDIEPLVTRISGLPASAQPAAYNHAVRRMWEGYQRPLAVRLIKVMAERVGLAAIAQYWIRHALEVEPELAREQFDRAFLDAYYRPEVARTCGSFG